MKKDYPIKNETGSAIIVVLILFVALIGYTLYFLGSSRIAADIKKKTQNDRTVFDVTAQIRAILSSPADCNATFSVGGPYPSTGGNLFQIKRCNLGNCYTGTNGTGSPFGTSEVAVTSSSWLTSVTKILQGNVRITDIRYTTTTAQTVDKPAIIKLVLTFEKRLRDDPTDPKISVVKTEIDQYVVFNTSGSDIKGCPRAPLTIDVAGDKTCHAPWDYSVKIPHNTTPRIYKYPHVIGCDFPGNFADRLCYNTVLNGSHDFTYETCINDGGWSTASHPAGPCTCDGSGGTAHRTEAFWCNNPAPDPGGLACDSSTGTVSVLCTHPGPPCP